MYSANASPVTVDTPVETFAQRGLAASQLNRSPSRRHGHLPTSALACDGILGASPPGGGAPRARAVAWLLRCRCVARCCLRPRGVVRHSSLAHRTRGLRALRNDRHIPKLRTSLGAMGRIQGIHPSPRYTDAGETWLVFQAIVRHASGRLTRPYPGGLHAVGVSLTATEHCQVKP